jgi:hypothetical protein
LRAGLSILFFKLKLNSLQLIPEAWQITLDCIPDQRKICPEIFMDQPVSHSLNQYPGNLRVGSFNVIGKFG